MGDVDGLAVDVSGNMEQAVAVTSDILRPVAREREVRADAAVFVLRQPSDPARAGDVDGESECLVRFERVTIGKTVRRTIPFDDIASVGTDRVIERLSGVDSCAENDCQRKEEKLIHDSV